MCHINCLQGPIQPHLDLLAGRLEIGGISVALSDQHLLGVSQQDPAVSQLLNLLDGALDLALVFAGVELLVDRLLDQHVQQGVLGHIEQGRLGVRQHRQGVDARLQQEGGRGDRQDQQRSQDGRQGHLGQRGGGVLLRGGRTLVEDMGGGCGCGRGQGGLCVAGPADMTGGGDARQRLERTVRLDHLVIEAGE